MSTAWKSRYALRSQELKGSAIRSLLKVTERPEIISFAGGLPAPEVFPVEQFEQACFQVLDEHGPQALQYGTTEGYQPLREMIARNMVRYGILAQAGNVLITTGSQQALDLIGKLFINRGDRILVEAPTYLGALQAFNLYGAQYVSVPVDEDGLRTDLLETSLRAGVKFMYVLPNFQNPTGATLSEARRHELIHLADRYGIPIVEDDPYGKLRYEGEHLAPLVVLDRDNLRRDEGYTLGNVIYLSTFSKTLAPGIRLAWVVAPPDVISKLVQLKQSADLHTSTFIQMVAYQVSRRGFLDEHARRIREVYRERRDAMLQALEQYFPPEVAWTHPQGGLFLWVTLPPGVNVEKLAQAALRENVAFVPGDSFFARNGHEACGHLRLNFSHPTPEHIREGIRRLAGVVKEHLHVIPETKLVAGRRATAVVQYPCSASSPAGRNRLAAPKTPTCLRSLAGSNGVWAASEGLRV